MMNDDMVGRKEEEREEFLAASDYLHIGGIVDEEFQQSLHYRGYP